MGLKIYNEVKTIMDSNYSLADIKAVTDNDRDDDGRFGGNGMWLIVLFLFVFMGGGGGFGGFGNNAAAQAALTQSDLQRGFDTNAIVNKLDNVGQGICDSTYALNTGMLTGFNGVNNAVMQAQFAAQQCCCETNRNIDSVRYDAERNACSIVKAIQDDGAATRALINATETQRLRDELDQARGIISNTTQSQYILGQLGQFRTFPPCPYPCPCGTATV